MNQILVCILFSVSFLMLFVMGELLFHKLKVRSEYTRKFTHIGGAAITLLFPIYLETHWAVLILSSLFALILFVTDKFKLLQSVHSVNRITFGGFLFPVAIYMSFISFELKHDLSYYYLPVSILALCDPAAALVGQAFPWKPIKIGSETKTIAGFLAFLFMAFLLCILWYLFTAHQLSSKLLLIISISLGSALIEFVSKKGLDNVTIPAMVLLMLFLSDM